MILEPKMNGIASPARTTQPVEFQSASEMLELLRSRKIGAVELLQIHLGRVEKYNPALNVIVAQDVEGALAAARDADDRPASDLPLLHGLPMTIKDTYEVVGMPATCGFPFLANHMPQQDADAVTRLKAAGAVVFGKTNVPTAAFDWQSQNPVYGTSNNPWDPTRTPGGSSGGAAAAIAAGLSALELGSDIGGSIRVPAHFCGVYGHKPSYGVVPLRGHIPPMPGELFTYQLGVGGPLARSAHDLELALDVLVSPPELEAHAWSIRIPPSRHKKIQDFRVALWADDSTYAVDAQCLDAIEAFAQDLRRLGVSVNSRARPQFDPEVSFDTYFRTLMQPMGGGMSQQAREQFLNSAAALPSNCNNYRARTARVLTARQYESFALGEQRERLFRSWRDFFGRYDIVICPVMPVVAYPHDHRGTDQNDPISGAESRSMMVNGSLRDYWDGLQWPSLAVVANLPATAVPTGRFIDGLPVGVQLIGPYLEDRTPLRFAQLIERAFGGFKAPSGYTNT